MSIARVARLSGWVAWRLHRRGLIGFTAAGFGLSVFYGFAFQQAAGTTSASRAAFGHTTTLLAKQFAFLAPIPVQPETLGGYEQYKWISFAALLMLIWAALAAAGAARGDEDRGLSEQWLSAGVGRTQLLLARGLAFVLVAAIAAFATTVGVAVVAPAVKEDPNLGGELAKALSITAGLGAGYALTLLVAQLPFQRQTATSLAVATAGAMIVLNGLADSVDSLAWIGRFSPLHWMEQTTSSAPRGTFAGGATMGLVAAAVVAFGMAGLLFRRRDLGQGFVRPLARHRAPGRKASGNPILRGSAGMGLWEQRSGLTAWLLGSFLAAATLAGSVKAVNDALSSSPQLMQLVARIVAGDPALALLRFLWLAQALLLLAGYAVVQVSRWSTLDEEGRVAMELSAPLSRARLMVERAVEFALASGLIVLAGYLGAAAGIQKSGLSAGTGRLLVASLMLWAFALAFGGTGVALAARWPRIAMPVLLAFVLAEYFLGDLAPLFNAPDWVANLSLFHLYGNPLQGRLDWIPSLEMVVVSAAGLAIAMAVAQRRDLSR